MTNKATARKSYEAAMAAARSELARKTAPVPAIRFGMAPLHYNSYDPATARAEYDRAAAAARAIYDAAMRRV